MKSQIRHIGIRSIAVVVILLFIFTTQAGFGTVSPCGIIDGAGDKPGLSGIYIAFSPLAQCTPTVILLSLCINTYTVSLSSTAGSASGISYTSTTPNSYQKRPLYLLHLVLRD